MTLDELKAKNIDPDNCYLYWLCDMSLKDWIKLPPEEKDKRSHAWNRKPPRVYGSIRSEDPSPRFRHDHIEGFCPMCR